MSLFGGEFPPLRPFQTAAHEALRQGVREGHRRQLIMAPTGAGKTILAMNVINETLKKGNRAMFVCDRKTLIAQTSNVARELGLGHHGIIQAQNPMFDMSRRFQIASCQTLMRRGWPQDMDVIVVDEAHCLYKTWVDYVTSPDCKALVVGLSATPFARGLGKIFSNLINAATMHDLTESGVLVPMRVFSCRKPDMAGAETSGGEWTDRAAEERELVLVGDVVTEWNRIARGLKTIIFGATIRHCEEIVRQFGQVGVSACAFTADTKDEERADILRGFTSGAVQVLVSVEALAKGFDVKDVGAICDCRPLRKSLSTAIQMWGRGLRSSPETSKSECILLDFSGNVIRFADDYSDIFHNGLGRLDDGERLDKEVRRDEEKEPRVCPKCGYTPMGKICVRCGFKVEPQALIETKPGHLQEVILGGKRLAANHEDLYNQIATYARRKNKPGGNPQGRAYHLFHEITGIFPPHSYRVERAPEVEPTRATLGKIRSLQIAFARRAS